VQVHELHPEAKRTLSSWAKNDPKALIFETASGHSLSEVTPHCQTL
jgi:hypothetical protein